MPESTSRRRFCLASAALGLTALARPVGGLAASMSVAASAPLVVPPSAPLALPPLPTPVGAPTPLTVAKAGLQRLGARIPHGDVVGVADYGLPSSQPRLHLVDIASGRTTTVLVAHGRGSDPTRSGWLHQFSNALGSDCTSEGAFLTATDYVGEHGRSIRLIGLDPSNDNADSRGIVVHQAPYVGPAILKAHGVLGRSEGCFAVSPADMPQMLQRLGPGRLLISTKL